jgi:hypothetical protein
MSELQNPDLRTPESETDHPYAARLARAQMIALTRQARLSNLVPPVNSVILGVLLWGNVATTALLAWVGVVWLVSAVRWRVYLRFDRVVAGGAGFEPDWRNIWTGARFLAGAA